MCFPQSWDGKNLQANVLILPHEDPTAPLVTNIPMGVNAPPFASAKLSFTAMVIDSLDNFPQPVNVTRTIALNTVPPANALQLFQTLSAAFKITQPSNIPTPASASTYMQKYLPLSYRNSFPFTRPNSPYAKTDDSYSCLMKTGPGTSTFVASTDDVSWGQVFAYALRQPVLAKQLGFIYNVSIPLPANTFAGGGWLYFDLAPGSDYVAQVAVSSDILKRYAARIPALTQARSLFAPVLFPVSTGPVLGDYDQAFIETEDYDDGFAKIVHCMQPVTGNMLDETADTNTAPPTRDYGIRLGWDDEQLLNWQNRQMLIDPAVGNRLDAPMGVFNHRIDVRPHGGDNTTWNSLSKVQGDLVLGGIDLGSSNLELGVDVGPNQVDYGSGVYWLPMYYTRWDGASLVVKDIKAATLAGTDSLVNPMLKPVDADKVPLLYGNSYDFRVRYADISGGGPTEQSVPVNGGPAQVAGCGFRRYIPPQKVSVQTTLSNPADPGSPPTQYAISRPLLGFPALLYTGLNNAYNLLLADVAAALAAKRECGYFDPDAAQVQIDVLVRGPEPDYQLSADDHEAYYALFTTYRSFPADITQPIQLDIQFQDAHVIKYGDPTDLGDLPLTTPTSPLILPTGRDIQINITAVGKTDNSLTYFGSQASRFGAPVAMFTRAASSDETNLFVPEAPVLQFCAIMLQPDPAPTSNLNAQMLLRGQDVATPANLFQRLAQQLDLDTTGTALFGKPGVRVAIGCSKAIRNTLSPDGGSITFASKQDLTRQWIPLITLDLQRDWAWNALAPISFTVTRNGVGVVGTIEVKASVSATCLSTPDRTHTRIIFFDAVSPLEFTGPFPTPENLSYTITPQFAVAPQQQDAPLVLQVTVPVAAPPAQVPKILSVGIAQSPYVHSSDYSSTSDRQRMLWVEFDQPVQNPADSYFGFVKAYSPDPILLASEEPVPDPKEELPSLPDELIRVITPGQSQDQSGLNAMQQLIPCTDLSPRHFLVPLPPGLTAYSKELFGFFVYQFCVGHSTVWSTAQARFGRPIRVTGVQHPAPVLTCTADATQDQIVLSAPYANPVYNGSSLLPFSPRTEIWGALYAQVRQLDGAAYRNLLLDQKIFFQRQKDRLNVLQGAVDVYGTCTWTSDEIQELLATLGLAPDTPLSVLAIELYRNYTPVAEPISGDLGKERMYRTSSLYPVPPVCCC